ncbi:MAG: hypothetical protein LBQ16_01245 [Gracilibacteraceae bacterium]|jgi:hypothetical protein|nr:hypothetical protein [Gracilibacteraceae bacterium]
MPPEEKAKVYDFQIRRLLQPAVGFGILYPLLLWLFYRLSGVPTRYAQIFMLIYIAAAISLILLIVFANSQKVLIENDTLIFRSLLGSETLEPGDIRRIVFTQQWRAEVVRIKSAANKIYLLSDFYFPFNELSAELEDLIRRYQISSNLDA